MVQVVQIGRGRGGNLDKIRKNRPHICHRYHRLYPWRKICHVEKCQIYVKNLNNLWSFIEIYAVFVLNLCGEKSVWKKSVWRKNGRTCKKHWLVLQTLKHARLDLLVYLVTTLTILFLNISTQKDVFVPESVQMLTPQLCFFI